MDHTSLDWPALERLRELFLGGGAARGPYWRDARDLAAYDATYAKRIGWKWDALLAELTLRGWRPPAPRCPMSAPAPATDLPLTVAPSSVVLPSAALASAPTAAPGLTVLDWGCGSGIAGRRVVAWLGGAPAVASLHVWDHSSLACDFAATRARVRFPGLEVRSTALVTTTALPAPDVLVLSHVANELSPAARAELLALVRRVRAVLWVEPGTRTDARALQRTRDELRDTFHVVAPCTHEASCGLLAPGRDDDWCHHFARPPAGVQADSEWVRFAQRAGIDLRSLPYACLVLEARSAPASPAAAATLPPEATRVIGRPEHFKPYARILACRAAGCSDLEVPKRTCGALYKHLERTRDPLLYRLSDDGARVTAGEPLLAPPAEAAPPPETAA